MHVLLFLSGVLGNATGLFLFLAPMVTFKRIIRNRSTEQFSGIPYVMTLLNCIVFTWYGLPFVSRNNILIWTINATGGVIEFTYIVIFIIFGPKKERMKVMGLFALIMTVFSAIASISLLALHGNTRKFFCGVAAALFSTVMFASPLSVMRLVIKTKSVEFMPFFLSLFAFLCALSWLIYGLLSGDPFVLVPNVFGTGLGIAQLILYAIYYKNRNHSESAIKDDFIEMDLENIDQVKKPDSRHL
ncbi:bidirectional sugar transporter SWEET1 isoform X1 [Eucalyptus grandis]|uniref:bidirectional sugar transporter SWEET1 isoform X1 n=1 Tax=Eucalyptus grandis TaxID=71139 RepID=UPI00192E851B|nr:bidirectional sugar transporter SWEET1 isoform X1 [Eucalyptus grandis]